MDESVGMVWLCLLEGGRFYVRADMFMSSRQSVFPLLGRSKRMSKTTLAEGSSIAMFSSGVNGNVNEPLVA